MEKPMSDESLVHVLGRVLPIDDLQQLISPHGTLEVPNSTRIAKKKLKTEDRVVMKFNTVDELLMSFIKVGRRIDEIRRSCSIVNNIPDNCMMQIFSYLPLSDKFTVEKVCKRWLKLSEKGWPDVTHLDLRTKIFSKEVIEVIFKRSGRFIKNLSIGIDPETISCLPIIKEHCQLDQLQVLEVECKNIDDRQVEEFCEELADIFRQCNNLTSVVILSKVARFKFNLLEKLPPKTLWKITLNNFYFPPRNHFCVNLSQFHHLRELVLKNGVIDVDNLKGFENLTNLVNLEIVWCVIHKSFFSQIRTFVNLEKFVLRGHKCEIDDDDISNIAINCKNIRRLELSHVPQITDKAFKDIATLSNLEVLDLDNVNQVTDNGLEHLSNVKCLKCYSCQGVRNHGLVRLIIFSANLRTLCISSGTSMTPDFIRSVNEVVKYRPDVKYRPLTLKLSSFHKKYWQIPKDLSSLLTIDWI